MPRERQHVVRVGRAFDQHAVRPDGGEGLRDCPGRTGAVMPDAQDLNRGHAHVTSRQAR